MNEPFDFLDRVVKAELSELVADSIAIYTFALYHDHESGTVSVCADTMESSRALVRQSNAWTMKYFAEHVRDGNWKHAFLFQANIGRSLSLGDFARVNVARTVLPSGKVNGESFYLCMAKAVIANQQEILSLALRPEDVVFCCSDADSEVGLVWSALPVASPADASDHTDATHER
jgi:hypothetical protein